MGIQVANDGTFDTEVLQSDKPVIVDFWAEWCGPCRQFLPIVEEFANEAGNVKVVKMNIDESPATPAKYGVRSIPTLVMFKGGEAVAVQVGSMTKSALSDWVGSHS